MPDDVPGEGVTPVTEDAPIVEPTVDVDVSVYEAKIAALEGKIAELTTTIAAKDAEIIAAKAANWDLLNSTPIPDVEAGEEISPDAIDITPDDLFGKVDD